MPGGAVLPMAGVSGVAVSPTHRRRGVLRAMFAELHGRMGDYPIAGLQASEAGIYGRFGYGPAMVEHKLTVDRREARFFADVPDPGGVRIVEAAAHREQLADIYERWRLQTPGGLNSPRQMWDEVLADREDYQGRRQRLLLSPARRRLRDVPDARERREEENRDLRAGCGDTASAYRAVARSARDGPHRDGDRLDVSRRCAALSADRSTPGADRRRRGHAVAADARHTRGAGGAQLRGRCVCRAGHFGRRAGWWWQIRARCARRQGAVCPDRCRGRCEYRAVSARQPVHGWPPCLGVRIRTSPAVQRLWTGGSAGRGVRHRRAS